MNTPEIKSGEPVPAVVSNAGSALTREQRLFDALKRITQYDSPDKIRRTANLYGLTEEETIEMAYENVIAEAKRAIRGMRRTK